MNTVLNFFQDIFTGANQKPVGLTSFKDVKSVKVVPRKHVQKSDVKLSDLMRRVH